MFNGLLYFGNKDVNAFVYIFSRIYDGSHNLEYWIDIDEKIPNLSGGTGSRS